MKNLLLKVLLLNFGIVSVAVVVWVIYATGNWTRQIDEIVLPISSSLSLSFGIISFIAIGLALMNYWIIRHGLKYGAIPVTNQMLKNIRRTR